MRTKRTKRAQKETLEEKVIAEARENGAGKAITRTKRIFAAIREGMIRVQVWSESESATYPLKDYEVAL